MSPLSKSKISSLEKYVLPTGFIKNFSFGSTDSMKLSGLLAAHSDNVCIFVCDAELLCLSPYVACCLKEMLFAFSEWMYFSGERTDPNTKQEKLSTALCFSVTSCTPERWIWKAARS